MRPRNDTKSAMRLHSASDRRADEDENDEEVILGSHGVVERC